MVTETDQVRALQQAILERARELADEHIAQGELTRSKVIGDMQDKLKILEQKLLSLLPITHSLERWIRWYPEIFISVIVLGL